MARFKETPVTPVDGFLSLQCSSGRCHACRCDEWSCHHECHSERASSSPPPLCVGEDDGRADFHRSEHGSSGRGTARPGQSATPTT